MTKDVSLARSAPPFVGREHELQRLTQRLRSPRQDTVEVLLITGEPGVGKTRLMQEAVTVARGLRWLTLVGHAYDTEGMPPYLPFIEALQEYATGSQPAELEARLAEAGPEVALLVPALGRTHSEPASAQSDPETQRYRLFESVCDFLLKTPGSPYAGLLLCLDDLHWADESTLLLLEHLTRKQTSAPIVILATYRDTELDVSRPLARTLGQLARLGVASRIDLKRLDQTELSALLAALGGSEPPQALVDAIFSETEGNPFFVREVFEYLAGGGRLFDTERHWQSALELSETDVPQGLRLVIGRRLERLSEESRSVLAFAAVLGRSFSYELLREVARLGEEPLLQAIEEAEHAHLLTSDAGSQISFAHELIRQTLLSNLSALRRQRLHLSAAEAIEKLYAEQVDIHVSELAGHLLQAGSGSANLSKAVHYAELAAQRAVSVYAYGEAIRLLDRGVEAQDALDLEDKGKRCDLLLALIAALLPAGENRRVLDEVAPLAYSLAESLDDRSRMGAVARAAVDATARVWSAAGLVAEQGSTWLRRADENTDPETPERVLVDVRRAGQLGGLDLGAQKSLVALDAYAMAKRLGDREALFHAAAVFLNIPPPVRFIDDLARMLQEMMGEPREGVSFRTRRDFLANAAAVSLICGDRMSFNRLLSDLEMLAAQVKDSYVQNELISCRLIEATIDGRFLEALDLYDVNNRAMNPYARLSALIMVARIKAWLGRLNEVAADVESVAGFWSLTTAPTVLTGSNIPAVPQTVDSALTTLLAVGGMTGEAKARLSAWTASGQPDQETNLSALVAALEAAITLGDASLAGEISRELKEVAHLSAGARVTLVTPGRLLGAAAALNGDASEARALYTIGLRAAEKIRFRPEIALIRSYLGELMLKQFPAERTEAIVHLDFAIAEFEAMGMQPSLERALRLRGRRRPQPKEPAYPDGLSEREVEVLRLVAAGKSNREIAEGLVLSVRTVARHITNIYAKIGTRSKAEATAYAFHRGLT